MLQVAEIWHYPVKTMAGEQLQHATIGPLGITGDRVVHVEDAKGRVITARSHPRFLGHKASLGVNLEPLVDGRPWSSLEVAADVQAIAGPGARLVRDESANRFDILPLLTSFDPDTLVQDKQITRDIYRRFAGKLALDCFVIESGEINVGDEVRFEHGSACQGSAGAQDFVDD